MSEPKDQQSEGAESNGHASEPSETAIPSAVNSKPDEEAKGVPRPTSGSILANKIAAFASGVAPVKSGMSDASEDSITVEDVLHKLDSATRRSGDGNVALPLPLVRSTHQYLVTARNEASRAAKELAELKASRVQLIPPSAWVKREAKYKMDQEKHEHTVSMLNQRIERLEAELQILREGANLKPLEEKIKDLESQLVAASEEKTKVQSKFHELSIKHRQLIETSPQVATIWNEVLVQQAQAHGDAAAEQRLRNFDLRHTGAHSGLSMSVGQGRGLAAATGEVSPRKLLGVNAAAAIFSGGIMPQVPISAAGVKPDGRTVAAIQQQHLLEAASIDTGPATPVVSDTAAAPESSAPSSRAVSVGAAGPAAAAGPGPGSIGSAGGVAAAAAMVPQTAEQRAHALMEAVALEGLSPEASIAALQQLNYDLTMQLGLYQQMVGRLKDAMEQSDLEKAELEADKVTLEHQLAAAAAPGHGEGPSSALSPILASSSSKRGWNLGGLWRRGGAAPAADDGEIDGSLADTNSVTGLASIGSSRTTSMDLEAALGQQGGQEGSPLPVAAAETPALSDPAEQQQQQQQLTSDDGNSSSNGEATQQQQEPGSASAATARTAGGSAMGRSASSISRMLSQRRAAAAARAASAAETMQKDLKEIKRQLASVQDENKFLVHNLVEIKMELAETQSSHDQAKRALVRAMDREVCLDTKVAELSHMLDMLTAQHSSGGIPAIAAGAAAGAALAPAAIKQQAGDTGAGAGTDSQQSATTAQDAADVSAQSTEGAGPHTAAVDATKHQQQPEQGLNTSSKAAGSTIDGAAGANDAPARDADANESGGAVDAHSINPSDSDEFDSTLSRTSSSAETPQQDVLVVGSDAP